MSYSWGLSVTLPLSHNRVKISVAAASKLLSNMAFNDIGLYMGVMVAGMW
jgi:hypothetical protein